MLLEMERLGEASATELSDRLDAPFDQVNYALKQLVEEGAAEFVRREPSRPGSNTWRNIYRLRVSGWDELLEVLDRYAERLPEPGAEPSSHDGPASGGDAS